MMRRFLKLELPESFTTRPDVKLVWASNAVDEYSAKDPDTDTQHHLFIEDRYESIGWKRGEKPPEQWQNFLQQISDAKLQDVISTGVFSWFSDVTYPKGAIAVSGGNLYISVIDNNVGNELGSASSWMPICYLNAEDYNASLQTLVTACNNHIDSLSTTNPHNDNIRFFNGYTIEEIDEMLSADGDNNMAAHVRNKGNPHNLTCEQVNVLSAKDGGVFTGTVRFSSGILIGSACICVINTIKNKNGK
jgi:hypothetical protein